MPDTETIEGLMVWVMNQFARTFGPHAILKGGMSLRLLDCPRTTNDLDYVFIPYESKKDIAPEIIRALSELQDTEVTHTMNSKCLRCLVTSGETRLQVEVQVAMECRTEEASTTRLAHSHGQQGQIIRVMSFDWALAHKLAAWNERRLMRDLYDVYFMYAIMGVTPDVAVLRERLAKVERRGPASRRNRPRKMSVDEFARELERTIADLAPETVVRELRDYLAPDELVGLDMKMKIAVRQLIDHVLARDDEARP